MRTVAEVVSRLERARAAELDAPHFRPTSDEKARLFLAAECMRNHTADAGWQLTLAFQEAGYELCGHGLANGDTDVPRILRKTQPSIVAVQDKREWECKTAKQGRNRKYAFHRVGVLKERDDIFKVTVLKDAHQEPEYHRQSADEMGVHAWVTYYHPEIVKHVSGFVRPRHCIRTYHTVDRTAVPAFRAERNGTCVSGAVSGAYPFRRWVIKHHSELGIDYHRHPGYGANGCVTPQFLRMLSTYKVSICTSSMFGYSLRKIIESTAAGCMVVTDLPVDDKLPMIDGNLVRVRRDSSLADFRDLIRSLESEYDHERQEDFARLAVNYYDWRTSALRLKNDISRMRVHYF